MEQDNQQSVEVIKPNPESEIQEVPNQSLSVEAIIVQAIKKGVPVETMERILAMRKELKAEQAEEKYYEAMANAQAEFPDIKKNKTAYDDNQKPMYQYATLDHIVSQVRGIISRYGLSYAIKTEFEPGKVKSICIVKHIAGHSETSEMEVPFGNKTRMMSDSQVTAAAATFSKRYAFMNAFGIMTGDEDKEENLKLADQGQIEQVIKLLDQCKTIEELKKTWTSFSKEIKANKEVITRTNQLKTKLQNENS